MEAKVDFTKMTKDEFKQFVEKVENEANARTQREAEQAEAERVSNWVEDLKAGLNGLVDAEAVTKFVTESLPILNPTAKSSRTKSAGAGGYKVNGNFADWFETAITAAGGKIDYEALVKSIMEGHGKDRKNTVWQLKLYIEGGHAVNTNNSISLVK